MRGWRRDKPACIIQVSDWREMAWAGPFASIYLDDVLRDVAGKVDAVGQLERYGPSRLVVREMEEVKILPRPQPVR